MIPKKVILTEFQRTFLGKGLKNVLCQVWLKLTHFWEDYDKDTSWVFSSILQILPLERMAAGIGPRIEQT